MIGEDPVVLLGHPAVEAAQSGLDVHEGDLAGVGRQGPGQGGVGVTLHHDRLRGQLGEQLVEAAGRLPDLSTA